MMDSSIIIVLLVTVVGFILLFSKSERFKEIELRKGILFTKTVITTKERTTLGAFQIKKPYVVKVDKSIVVNPETADKIVDLFSRVIVSAFKKSIGI